MSAIDPGSATAADRPVGRSFATRSPVVATHGIVATSVPLAAQIGLEILRKGGNAIDAAIATDAALGLMEPTSSGMGGDLFAIVWTAKDGQLHGLNSSGRAPMGMTIEKVHAAGVGDRLPDYGPFTVTVPGCVDGWFALHDRYGHLKMKEILAPAVRTAREGFPVTEVIAYYWKFAEKRYADRPEFIATYLPGGHAPKAGDIFRNPNLAASLEIVAKKGRDGFYKGDLARRIAACVQEAGGFMTEADLALDRPGWVDPVSTTYRGYEVWELPPNGQGACVLEMLNMLEPYDLAKMGFGSAEHLHLLAEVKKLVYADRAVFYADPAFAELPLKQLISKDYARRRLTLIDPQHAMLTAKPGELPLRLISPGRGPGAPGAKLGAPPEKNDTIYLTVVDKDRNAVSLIQSNYAGFGSGLVPQGAGFGLQNRGNLFSLDPESADALAPGKRPFHTIIPAMVTKDGRAVFSFGVMGGDMQPQGHVEVLCNILDFGMNVQEAGDAPRLRHTGSQEPTGEAMTDGGELHLERGFADSVVAELKRRGHRIGSPAVSYGGYQGIWIDWERGVLIGGSESRSDGCAVGY
jgi:gamma-glutamyltranspeptidase/glutathione hydrolase